MTRDQALAADYHTELHYGICKRVTGPRGGVTLKVETWRINGRCKTWKTRPEDFSLPIKYGFKGPYDYVTPSNMESYHLAAECQPLEMKKGA